MSIYSPLRLLTIPLLAVVLLASTFLLAGCGEQEPRDAVVEDLRLLREGNGDQILQGVFVNTAGKHIRGARIAVDLFEADSLRPADTISFEVRDVEPGQSKTFRETIDTRRQLTGARLGQIVLF